MNTSPPIRVGIVDPYTIVRTSLQVFLETTPDLIFVGEADSEAEILAMCERDKPDVVLIDFQHDGSLGAAIIDAIHQRFPKIALIVLTTMITPERIVAALIAGAIGYLYKQVEIDTLAQAIRSAHKGERIFDAEVQHILKKLNYVPSNNALSLPANV